MPGRVVCIWFGLTYEEDYEGIELWVEKSGCSFYDEVREALHKRYECKLYEDSEGCSIAMDGGQFNTFLSCRDLKIQLQMITDIFREFKCL